MLAKLGKAYLFQHFWRTAVSATPILPHRIAYTARSVFHGFLALHPNAEQFWSKKLIKTAPFGAVFVIYDRYYCFLAGVVVVGVVVVELGVLLCDAVSHF